MRLYKTIIKPIVVYGSETWTVSARAVPILSTWERKVLRRIHGPISDRGVWRIRTNQELLNIYKDIAIKVRRIDWLGHVKK